MKTAKLNQEEAAAAEPGDEQYLLKLFITGSTPKSTRAIQNLRAFCEENLDGSYQLDVIDLYQSPELAGPEQVSVTPTLVKKFPLPVRRLLGDLSDNARLAAGLGIDSSTSLDRLKQDENDC